MPTVRTLVLFDFGNGKPSVWSGHHRDSTLCCGRFLAELGLVSTLLDRCIKGQLVHPFTALSLAPSLALALDLSYTNRTMMANAYGYVPFRHCIY